MTRSHRAFSGGVFTPSLTPPNAEDTVRALDPEYVRIVVAGGPGNFIGFFGGRGACVCVTKKAALPAAWESLVRQYRDMVPTHVRY